MTHEPLAGVHADTAQPDTNPDTTVDLAEARHASIEFLSARVDELRLLIADVRDSVDGGAQLDNDGIMRILSTFHDMADATSRTAQGFLAVNAADIVYPDVVSDLDGFGWTRVVDTSLDRILPPCSGRELVDRSASHHGCVVEFVRGTERLRMWLTSPMSMRYAWASSVGRLYDTAEVTAIVRASAEAITGTRDLPREPDPCAAKSTSEA